MTRPNAVPRVPTPPRGDEIASYATYLEAQKAVDYLSDSKFHVEFVTIVGRDLRMVERVTGRLTYGRVALAGLASGAWFGLFVGLLLLLFSAQGGFILVAIALGAGFGLLFSVLSYALTRGRRDFTSSSQIVASSYALLCAPEQAGEARRLLVGMPDAAARLGSPAAPATPANPRWGQAGSAAPGADAVKPDRPVANGAPPAPAPDPRFTTPSGEPRYGAMRPTSTAPTPPADEATRDDV